jgi:hypothetical protein
MTTNETDALVHPASQRLAAAIDQIHADYEAVMAKRTDRKGHFDPMKLPDDRECIPAGRYV